MGDTDGGYNMSRTSSVEPFEASRQSIKLLSDLATTMLEGRDHQTDFNLMFNFLSTLPENESCPDLSGLHAYSPQTPAMTYESHLRLGQALAAHLQYSNHANIVQSVRNFSISIGECRNNGADLDESSAGDTESLIDESLTIYFRYLLWGTDVTRPPTQSLLFEWLVQDFASVVREMSPRNSLLQEQIREAAFFRQRYLRPAYVSTSSGSSGAVFGLKKLQPPPFPAYEKLWTGSPEDRAGKDNYKGLSDYFTLFKIYWVMIPQTRPEVIARSQNAVTGDAPILSYLYDKFQDIPINPTMPAWKMTETDLIFMVNGRAMVRVGPTKKPLITVGRSPSARNPTQPTPPSPPRRQGGFMSMFSRRARKPKSSSNVVPDCKAYTQPLNGEYHSVLDPAAQHGRQPVLYNRNYTGPPSPLTPDNQTHQ